MVNKSVNLNLVGLDGNAFALLGAFQRQARREGWTPEEIKEVMDEAQSSDYAHLVGTLSGYCKAKDEDGDGLCPCCGDELGVNGLTCDDCDPADI